MTATDDTREALTAVISDAYLARHGMKPLGIPAKVDADIAAAVLASGLVVPASVPTLTDGTRNALETAIGGVLFNVGNFPEAAQSRLLGRDMGPLREKLVDAVVAHERAARIEAWDRGFAFSYHSDRADTMPDHLVEDVREWNPYRDPQPDGGQS